MGRFGRRALLRGAVSAAVATLSVLPWRRRARGVRGAAATGAAVVGAGLEQPALGALLLVAGASALARARGGAVPAVAGVGAGAAVALALTRAWPVAPRTPAEVRRNTTHVDAPPVRDGEGVTVVVNTAAGSPLQPDPVDALRERLPRATLLEVGDSGGLDAALGEAASAAVLGAAGGDGTINAVAGAARDAAKPLLVVPTGTLNHFTRDLGVVGVEDAVEALQAGHAVAVDTGTIAGRPFLNTASFGTYGELVDARERLEARIGKWPALVVALVRLLRTAEPMDVELDGHRRRLWMVFVGNCTYSPPGFAPAWRERLDDGWLDVRLVDASRPLARVRLLLAVVTGRLARTAVYEAFRVRELRVRAVGGPLRLACDGETFDADDEFRISKGPPLAVYALPPT